MMDDEPERMDPRCDAGGRGYMLWMEYCNDGEYVRATDYDALAAKLNTANPLDDPRVAALVKAAKDVEGRFYQAAKMFHNTQSWGDEEQDGQPLDDWVFSPIRAALSALEENK